MASLVELSIDVSYNSVHNIISTLFSGFPMDMPVGLSYFEENELKFVNPSFPDYDHLINHVSVQMDNNDFQLYKTPVVLTLQVISCLNLE